mgnify:CR=1 FL=1
MSENYWVSVRLTANDIGATGSHVAGIYIPKDPRILSILPKLDTNERNPDTWCEAYFPQLGRSFNLRYIYYNNQFWSSGKRNEYRITWIREALGALNAQVGDELVFSKSPDLKIELREEGTTGEQEVDLITTQINERWSVTIREG